MKNEALFMKSLSANAECTWAEGPDVLVVVDDRNESGFPLSLDPDGRTSFGLTRAEARELAAELLDAAERADEQQARMAAYEVCRRGPSQ